MNNNNLTTTILDEDESAVRFCMNHKAINATDLHVAAQVGNINILQILMQNGYKQYLNTFDEFSFTPLMWAARYEHYDCVKFLLDSGADINIANEPEIGNTVLREVVRDGSLQMITLLAANGADPKIPGWMGLTAIDIAEERFQDNPDSESRAILNLLRGEN